MINDLWYKNAVIYCLSVGTYMDANGDGTGDFQGLMRRFSRHLDAGDRRNGLTTRSPESIVILGRRIGLPKPSADPDF